MENIVKLDSGKLLRLKVVSSREVIARVHSCSELEVTKEGDKITALNVEGYKIEVDQPLNIKMLDGKKTVFKPLNIKESTRYENSYILTSTTLTKAARWVMPMVAVDNDNATAMKFNSYFINCYVGYQDVGYMDEISLVYRFSPSLEYTAFEDKLTKNPHFDRMVNLDKYHTMFIFNIPDEYKEDFSNFKAGKYSRFSENYKKKILSFRINMAVTAEKDIQKTNLYGVLNKTALQRKRLEAQIGQSIDKSAEYYSIPEEHEEVYTGDIEITNASAIKPEEIE